MSTKFLNICLHFHDRERPLALLVRELEVVMAGLDSGIELMELPPEAERNIDLGA
jgi:hypothetical protein